MSTHDSSIMICALIVAGLYWICVAAALFTTILCILGEVALSKVKRSYYTKTAPLIVFESVVRLAVCFMPVFNIILWITNCDSRQFKMGTDFWKNNKHTLLPGNWE